MLAIDTAEGTGKKKNSLRVEKNLFNPKPTTTRSNPHLGSRRRPG